MGGNVSLYNEAPAGPIFPTPVIGMVGRLPDAARAGRLGLAGDGDAIALVGSLTEATAAGSELAKLRGEPITGPLPPLHPDAVREAHEVVRAEVRSGALVSAHDVAEGGLAVALAETCLAGGAEGIGARVTLPGGVDPFTEAPGRAFVVSGDQAVLAALPGATVIGHAGGDRLAIEGLLDVALSELHAARERGLLGFL